MKKDHKDVWFIIFIALGILFLWIYVYNTNPELKKEIKNKEKNVLSFNSIKKKDDSDKNIQTKLIKTDNPVVVLETTDGNIEIELYLKKMHITAGNFKKLVEEKFYDGVRFHRVIDGFMIQSGDPNTKELSKKPYWGQGGPGYAIKDEFVKDDKLSNKKYTIAMANSGPNTGGSQFFINTVDNTYLDFDKKPFTSKHPVFGKVIKGFDVVEKIEKSHNGEVIIKKAYIKK